jgi:hypothetical protein
MKNVRGNSRIRDMSDNSTSLELSEINVYKVE